MLQDGSKMLPRWFQDGAGGSQDGPKRTQEEGQKRRKTIGFYRFSHIEGIMEQVGSQDGSKRPTDVPKMGPRGPKMLQDAPR